MYVMACACRPREKINKPMLRNRRRGNDIDSLQKLQTIRQNQLDAIKVVQFLIKRERKKRDMTVGCSYSLTLAVCYPVVSASKVQIVVSQLHKHTKWCHLTCLVNCFGVQAFNSLGLRACPGPWNSKVRLAQGQSVYNTDAMTTRHHYYTHRQCI